MAHQIRWSPCAVSHLESICLFIENDSPFYAAFFAKKINQLVKNIPLFPHAGRIVPEYANRTIREKIYRNYRIVYRIRNNDIEIVAICHSAKPLQDIL